MTLLSVIASAMIDVWTETIRTTHYSSVMITIALYINYVIKFSLCALIGIAHGEAGEATASPRFLGSHTYNRTFFVLS